MWACITDKGVDKSWLIEAISSSLSSFALFSLYLYDFNDATILLKLSNNSPISSTLSFSIYKSYSPLDNFLKLSSKLYIGFIIILST